MPLGWEMFMWCHSLTCLLALWIIITHISSLYSSSMS